MNADWRELKEKVYFEDGSFRDIYVLDVTIRQWEKWTDFVNQNYEVEFVYRETEQKTDSIDFEAVQRLWDGDDEFGILATVKINGININCHFFLPDEFENDILPKEIDSFEAHELLMKYLKDVSRIFDKNVFLTDENAPEFVLLEVSDSKISIKV